MVGTKAFISRTIEGFMPDLVHRLGAENRISRACTRTNEPSSKVPNFRVIFSIDIRLGGDGLSSKTKLCNMGSELVAWTFWLIFHPVSGGRPIKSAPKLICLRHGQSQNAGGAFGYRPW